MELIYLVVAIAGVVATVVFGFLQVVIPFLKGDVVFSKKFPFIISAKDKSRKEDTSRKESVEATKEVRGKRRTIMYIDIKGYIVLRLQDESRAREVLKEYRKIVCPEFSKYKGKQLKTKDDEFLLQFADTLDATSCAIEIQKLFNARNTDLPENRWINVRVGIHEESVAKRKKGISDDAEEIASIIGTHAKAGDIHITENVYRKIRYKVDAPIRELAKSELKEMPIQLNVYSVMMPWRGPPYSVAEKEDIELIKIAVVDFLNETEEKALDGLSGMLITALEQSRHLSVLTRSGMLDVLKQLGREEVGHIDESLGREIGRKANLNALAIASVRKFGEIYTTDLKVLNPQKDEYLFTASAEGRGQECIPQVIDAISRKTRLGLEEKISEIQLSSRRVSDITTINLEAYEHYFHGEECINKLNFKKAKEELKKAVALDPTFGLAYYRLAYAVDWERRGAEAKEYIKKAIALLERIPEKEKFLVRAMDANLEKGFKAGVEVLKEMEQIYPNDKEMLYNIGDWSYHLKKYEAACDYLERVLLMDPIHDRALQHLTWTYREMANYDMMLELAKRYETATGSDESYALIAQAYVLQGDVEGGLDKLRQFQRLYPQRYCITSALVDMYVFNRQYDKALSELASPVSENQLSQVDYYGRHMRSRLLPYFGKYREAIAAIDKSIELCHKRNDIAMAGFLRVCKGMYIVDGWQDTARAWVEAEETLTADIQMRTHAVYWALLTYLYIARGDYALAENVAKKTGWNWWCSLTEALIHTAKRECEKAVTIAHSFLDTTPGPGDIRIIWLYKIGECLLESGQWDKAEKFLLESQKVYSNEYGYRAIFYPKSLYLLGKLHEAKKNRTGALEYYEKFLNIWKDADEDLPEFVDAKKRLARLRKKETGTGA